MRKILWVSGLSIAGLLILLNSCGKSSSATPKETNMQLITSATWIYDTAGIDANNSGTITTAIPSGIIKPCDTDNTLTFYTNGTGVENDGLVKCSASTPQTTSFTWTFNSGQTQINIPDTLFNVITGAVNIISLTSTQLHLEKQVTYNGLPFLVAVYMKH